MKKITKVPTAESEMPTAAKVIRKTKPKMARKVPQRDGLAKFAQGMAKRFGG